MIIIHITLHHDMGICEDRGNFLVRKLCMKTLQITGLNHALVADVVYISLVISIFILLLVSKRALYWFTAVGSETVFYSNKCYKFPDWLLPRSYCYFPPKPSDTLCVVM